MTDISATSFFRQATAGTAGGQPPDFTFQHSQVDTGGSGKFQHKNTLRALHPETGEESGRLHYFAPKRKGSPVIIDEVEGHHPGAASALLNEMEARHPGSRVTHVEPLKRGKPHYDHPEYGNPSGWDTHYPNLPEQLHRGMGVRLSGPDARRVTQGIGSAAEHAEILRNHLSNNGPMGMHWSADEAITRNFAHRNIQDPRTDVPVIVHADVPDRKHIETRPDVLKQRGVWAHDYEYGDREVPIKRGGPMTIRSISWKPDAPHPEADKDGWLHHTFETPLQHKASLQGQRVSTTASLTDFFRQATTHPGPRPEDYAKQDGEDYYDHRDRVNRGLSLGHLTTEQAEATKGYDYVSGGWKPLPHTLYHTTTDAAGVAEHGLKAGHELGQKNGHGLGGTPKFLSLTDRADHAHHMLNALHEYHDVLNGKTSLQDLHEAAARGEGAQKPFDQRFMGAFGGTEHPHAHSTLREKYFEPGFRTQEEAQKEGLTPHPTAHQSSVNGKGDVAGMGWERDMTHDEKIEHRHNVYGNFSRTRHWEGGGPEPVLFMSNDRKAFAQKDPSNFAVLKVRPKPGAQGYEKRGEHEWRTSTGDAVQVHGEPLRRTSARIGQVVRPFERTASAQTWYTVRHYDAENIARHRNPNRRTYADLNEAQGHADQITQHEGLPPVTMVNTTHPDQSGYVHSHPHAGGGSIIGLGRNALDEGVLIHEMTHHLLHHKGISTDDHHAPAFGEHLGQMLDTHHSDPGAGPAFRDALQQTDHEMRTNPYGTSHSFKAPYPQMPAAEHKPGNSQRGTTPQRPAGPAAPPGPQPADRPRDTIQLRSSAAAPFDGTIYCRTHPTDLQALAAAGPDYSQAAQDYENRSWQTIRHYSAEEMLEHTHPPRKYGSLGEAQGHADEIADAHGVPRVKVTHSDNDDWSHYKPSAYHSDGVYGPVISLSRNSLNDHTLVHEMAHHVADHAGGRTILNDHHDRGFVGHHLELASQHLPHGTAHALAQHIADTDVDMRQDPQKWAEHRGHAMPEIPEEEQDPKKPSAMDRVRRLFRRSSADHTAGANGELPEGMQLHFSREYTKNKWYMPDGREMHYHAVGATMPSDDPDAHKGRERIGIMEWHPETGEVGRIHVDDAYHRRGVATKMWDAAHEISGRMGLTPPVHSEVQSPNGKQWAATTASADRRYFHGSPTHIPVGSYVEPGHETHYDASSRNHVYLTDNADEARQWGEDAHEMAATEGPVYVHEVRPEGEPTRKEHSDGFVEYHAPRAQVVRVTKHHYNWVTGSIQAVKASADTPVPDNTKPYEHEHDWLPAREHFFAPTGDDLDPRLFEGDRIRPEVRYALLGLLNDFWSPKYGDSWQSWARVYLAGSEASKFTGRNNDLDVLIGVDYDAARHHVEALRDLVDSAIDTKLTDELREGLNSDDRMLPGPGGKETGPYESTFYVNPDSWSLKKLKPYAAYDLTNDQWEVRPVTTPADFGPTKLPESTWDVVDALRALIKAIGELPEGTREREGAALWDYLHGDRHAAFGPDGTGLYDPANVSWKALDKAPGHPLQQLIDWKHSHDGAAATQEEAA